MMLKKSLYSLFGVFLLIGCGGGGGGSESTEPTATIFAPNFSDLNVTLAKDTLYSSIKIPNSGSDATSCEVSPALPSGLVLQSDCSISGTPTVNQSASSYFLVGRNTKGESNATISIEIKDAVTATISGKATYDYVPPTSNGLDYANTVQKSIRGAVVEIVDSTGNSLGTTTTDVNGNYSISVTGTTAKVMVYAKIYKAPSLGASSWDFQVKDNTNGDALYVVAGELHPIGTTFPDLNAPSGWGGSSYTSTRSAAPFAILDVIYSAVSKITAVQSDAVFPPLDIFWSKNNISSATKDVANGQIITSHYSQADNAFYILGAEDSDTDEYDSAIVAHEWSHYYEDKFSRSDSIGGAHGSGDMLDMRVAFGEGFATAFGCMLIDNNLYIDTQGRQQKYAGVSDVEDSSSPKNNPGWYSEASIYRILYDIYDSNDDTADTLSLGFAPIHNVLINGEKNTEAFTSIFSFITELKNANPGNDTEIDTITSNESIANITDIYGTGRTNRTENANPLYTHLAVGGSASISPDYSATSTSELNKLGVYNFVEFTISSRGNYTISATSDNSGSNLIFEVYPAGSNSIVLSSSGSGSSVSGSANLSAGKYRMAITDVNTKANATFTLSLSN